MNDLNIGDITAADLEGVEWLKVTEESFLGDSENYWNVNDGVVTVFRGDDGEKTDTRMMLDEAATALNNNEESSAAAETVGVEPLSADAVPVEV